MPTLSITKTYVNGQLLFEADLDNFKTALETLLNTTKLDSANIQTGGIASSNIAAAAITSSLLAASAVTSSAIAANAVTPAKLAAYNLVSSATDNNATVYNSTGTAQSIGAATITVSGVRPVFIGIKPSPTSNNSVITHTGTGATVRNIQFFDGTSTFSKALTPNGTYPMSQYWHIFLPLAAGSVTYTVYFAGISGDAATVSGQVFALEL